MTTAPKPMSAVDVLDALRACMSHDGLSLSREKAAPILRTWQAQIEAAAKAEAFEQAHDAAEPSETEAVGLLNRYIEERDISRLYALNTETRAFLAKHGGGK
jgi:hypothetical protein